MKNGIENELTGAKRTGKAKERGRLDSNSHVH